MRASSIGHLTGVQLPYGIHLIGVRLGLLRTLQPVIGSIAGRIQRVLYSAKRLILVRGCIYVQIRACSSPSLRQTTWRAHEEDERRGRRWRGQDKTSGAKTLA
jgi:hypothetical protein